MDNLHLLFTNEDGKQVAVDKLADGRLFAHFPPWLESYRSSELTVAHTKDTTFELMSCAPVHYRVRNTKWRRIVKFPAKIKVSCQLSFNIASGQCISLLGKSAKLGSVIDRKHDSPTASSGSAALPKEPTVASVKNRAPTPEAVVQGSPLIRNPRTSRKNSASSVKTLASASTADDIVGTAQEPILKATPQSPPLAAPLTASQLDFAQIKSSANIQSDITPTQIVLDISYPEPAAKKLLGYAPDMQIYLTINDLFLKNSMSLERVLTSLSCFVVDEMQVRLTPFLAFAVINNIVVVAASEWLAACTQYRRIYPINEYVINRCIIEDSLGVYDEPLESPLGSPLDDTDAPEREYVWLFNRMEAETASGPATYYIWLEDLAEKAKSFAAKDERGIIECFKNSVLLVEWSLALSSRQVDVRALLPKEAYAAFSGTINQSFQCGHKCAPYDGGDIRRYKKDRRLISFRMCADGGSLYFKHFIRVLLVRNTSFVFAGLSE